MRNPWARTVSLYYRTEGVMVRDTMSFEEFCEQHIYATDTCRCPSLHKNQYDFLSDENGKLLMDYVYKVEEFKQAIQEIEVRTNGRLVLQNVRKNVNAISLSSDYRNCYTDRTRKLIAKRFEKDIDFFKYTF